MFQGSLFVIVIMIDGSEKRNCKGQSSRVIEKLAFNSFWTRKRWDKLNIYFLLSFLPILYLLSIFFSFAGLSLSSLCEKKRRWWTISVPGVFDVIKG